MPAVPVPSDPLNRVLNHGRVCPVPVCPAYEQLGPLQFYRMELRWRKWWERLDRAGADMLAVDYQTYFDLELETHTDIIDTYYPPPSWMSLPMVSTPADIAGCAVVRRGEDLFWLSADGHESWVPPNHKAHQEALLAEEAPQYSRLWQPAHDVTTAVQRAAAHAPHELRPIPEPREEQADAFLRSGRFELARALEGRYPDLPFYTYGGSPYNSLMGTFGFQEMMTAFLDAPDVVHRILENRLPRPTARHLAMRKLGVGILFMEECLASADLISPRMYLEFCFPYTKRALQFYEDLGFRTVLYFSGNLMPLLQYMKQLPFTAISFEEDRKDYGIDLAEVRRVLGPDKVLFANIDAPFVETCSDAELLAEVRRQIDVAGRDGNFVVSVGSPLTPGTSLERVRLFCDSTRILGAQTE